MEGRDNDDRPVAATRMQMGTEVNYGLRPVKWSKR
nr:malate:quinone oxidoreductase [Halomonas sp. 15WGF]